MDLIVESPSLDCLFKIIKTMVVTSTVHLFTDLQYQLGYNKE